MYHLTVLPFFSVIWMQNILSVVDLLHWNTHWLSSISSVCDINFERRILNKCLYVVGDSDIPL
jgi:hypothetical protein